MTDIYEGSTRIVPIDVDPTNTDADVSLLDIRYTLTQGPPSVDGATLFQATDDDSAIELVDSTETIYEVRVPASAFSTTGIVTEEIRVSYSDAGPDWSTVEKQRKLRVQPTTTDP